MPTQQQVDALKTFIGQGELYNKCTAPTSGQPLAIAAE